MHPDEQLLLEALRHAAFEIHKMEHVTSFTADFINGVGHLDFDFGNDCWYRFELEESHGDLPSEESDGDLPSIELPSDLETALRVGADAMSTLDGITSAYFAESTGTVVVTVRGARSYILRQKKAPEPALDPAIAPEC